MNGYHCAECDTYCIGKDPHPGEADHLCRTCYDIREGLVQSGWRW